MSLNLILIGLARPYEIQRCMWISLYYIICDEIEIHNKQALHNFIQLLEELLILGLEHVFYIQEQW